ncbi:MAG: hypothetical protein K5739_06550 [Lachnospiraceae bacterium]|nr:hypothetical protein [Lachnospiraceae bacterium]
MMEKLRDYWESLDEEKVINGKLFLFEILTAALAGVLLGILLTPFRSICIASNNEGCSASDCGCCKDEDD